MGNYLTVARKSKKLSKRDPGESLDAEHRSYAGYILNYLKSSHKDFPEASGGTHSTSVLSSEQIILGEIFAKLEVLAPSSKKEAGFLKS